MPIIVLGTQEMLTNIYFTDESMVISTSKGTYFLRERRVRARGSRQGVRV